jgi:hypothetical protein
MQGRSSSVSAGKRDRVGVGWCWARVCVCRRTTRLRASTSATSGLYWFLIWSNSSSVRVPATTVDRWQHKTASSKECFWRRTWKAPVVLCVQRWQPQQVNKKHTARRGGARGAGGATSLGPKRTRSIEVENTHSLARGLDERRSTSVMTGQCTAAPLTSTCILRTSIVVVPACLCEGRLGTARGLTKTVCRHLAELGFMTSLDL